jgi:hypothetical protein
VRIIENTQPQDQISRYLVQQETGTRGPYNLDGLRSLAELEHITLESLVAREGTTKFKPICEWAFASIVFPTKRNLTLVRPTNAEPTPAPVAVIQEHPAAILARQAQADAVSSEVACDPNDPRVLNLMVEAKGLANTQGIPLAEAVKRLLAARRGHFDQMAKGRRESRWETMAPILMTCVAGSPLLCLLGHFLGTSVPATVVLLTWFNVTLCFGPVLVHLSRALTRALNQYFGIASEEYEFVGAAISVLRFGLLYSLICLPCTWLLSVTSIWLWALINGNTEATWMQSFHYLLPNALGGW